MIPERPKWRNPIAEHAKGLLKKELTHDLHRPLLRKVVPHGHKRITCISAEINNYALGVL